MIFLRRELPCRAAGEPLGRAEYEQQGPRLRFVCTLPAGVGLCKLWLVRGERRLLLGTPAPEGDGLALDRTLSRSLLESQGVYPPQRVEVTGIRTTSGDWNTAGDRADSDHWRPVDRQTPGLSDPLLRQLFCQGGWQWRPWARGVEFYHGWREGDPFPAVPLFCLAGITGEGHKIQVRLYLDRDGNPCFPP